MPSSMATMRSGTASRRARSWAWSLAEVAPADLADLMVERRIRRVDWSADWRPEPKPPKEKPVKLRRPQSRPKPGPPSELERVEAQIAAVELRIVELEGRLAGDWSDMDVLTAHRAARDELQELLLRWEELFEDASTR